MLIKSVAVAAMRRATASGGLASQPKKETWTGWVFCAMNTMRSTNKMPSRTTVAHVALVRDGRRGSFGAG
jgi:hypothetical protein